MNDTDSEIERLREYEKLVQFIANDYHELSYEKAQWQRDDRSEEHTSELQSH